MMTKETRNRIVIVNFTLQAKPLVVLHMGVDVVVVVVVVVVLVDVVVVVGVVPLDELYLIG